MSHKYEMTEEQYQTTEIKFTNEDVIAMENHNKVLWRELYEVVQMYNEISNPNDMNHIVVENFRLRKMIDKYKKSIEEMTL